MDAHRSDTDQTDHVASHKHEITVTVGGTDVKPAQTPTPSPRSTNSSPGSDSMSSNDDSVVLTRKKNVGEESSQSTAGLDNPGFETEKAPARPLSSFGQLQNGATEEVKPANGSNGAVADKPVAGESYLGGSRWWMSLRPCFVSCRSSELRISQFEQNSGEWKSAAQEEGHSSRDSGPVR